MINKGKSSYVSKIFNFDPTQSEGQQNGVSGGSGGAVPTFLDEQKTQVDDILATWSFGQNTPVDSAEMFLDWDSLDISNWDSFPYVNP